MENQHELDLYFQLVNLTGEIIDGADRATSLQDQVEWTEKNLWQMEDLLDRINGLHQLLRIPANLMEQIRTVVRKSEDVIDTYRKEESQQGKMTAICKTPVYWKERRYLKSGIMKIKKIMIRVLRQMQAVHTYNFTLPHMMPGSERYLNVPFHLTQCIYYFLLFPAEFDIPARRLIVLWVAEGLVRPNKDKDESAEHVAEHYLYELIKMDVVSVKRFKLNGKVKSCQLNDSLQRDALLDRAKEDGFFEYKTTGLISRLVDHNGTNHGSCFIHINGNLSSDSMTKYGDTFSLLSFNTQEGSKPGGDIEDFLNKCISAGCFQWMRVLDLERVFRPKLPKALSKLRFLRYLGLRWTFIEDLPDFVSKFFNLHVLDVKHTYISILPKSIWRMQYLRHLYLSESYRTRFDGRPSDISMHDLQTLWGGYIDEHTCVRKGLDTLTNIRKLGLSCMPSSSSENPPSSSSENSQPSSSSEDSPPSSSPENSLPSSSSGNSRMSKQLEAVDQWISNLGCLETLRLKSRDAHGKADHLHLTSLKENRKLSTVYLLGKLNPTVVTELPVSLTDITLSGSKLDHDPMQFLKRLRNLQYLRLLAHSVACNTIYCSREGFQQLKLLHIWKLENLEKWEVEEGSLPSLEVLDIRSSKKLNPAFVQKLPVSLTHITLSGSELEHDPMEFLGRLPDLQNLRLLAKSVVHNRMHCSRGDFPKLKLLHIWKLENLEAWEVEEESLPFLEELEIRSCKKLNPHVVRKFPASLTHITLSELMLDLDPMEYLKRLPNLLSLQLLGQSVVCNNMLCSRGGFLLLKVLKLWKLKTLEEWKVEEGSLPSLEELEIRSCQKLKMLPDGLQHVTTLKKFRLTSMPQTFIDQTKVTQPQLWAKIEHAFEAGKGRS